MLIFSWARSRKKLARLPSDATISTRLDDLQWICLNRHHTSLFGYKAPEWTDLEHDERASLVKSNPRRRIYHIQSSEYDFYAKIVRPITFNDRLKWLIRSCPSQVEFENLQIARARYVPVIQPIAWASSSIKNHPYGILVTMTVPNAYSFEELLWRQPKPDPKLTNDALAAVAYAVGKLHCACFQHRDLHPGNLLLAQTNEEDVSAQKTIAYISDLQSIRIDTKGGHASADPLNPWRIENLGMLLSGMRKRLTIDQQKYFAEKYIKTVQPHNTWSPPKIDDYFSKLRYWADQQDQKIAASRDRRALRNSKYSQYLQLGDGWCAQVYLNAKHPTPTSPSSSLKFTAEQWLEALQKPHILLNSHRILKEGSHSTVLENTLSIGGHALPIMVKQSRRPQGWRGLPQIFLNSRALRQWHKSHMLINRGLPTPWPLAALDYFQKGLRQQDIFISEKIPNAQNLRTMIKNGDLPHNIALRRDLADQIAQLLASLRLQGFRHRDCKATNVLIEYRPNQTPAYKPYLIDLDGLRRYWIKRSNPPHLALVRLAASGITTQKLNNPYYARVFHRYLQLLKLPEAQDRTARHQLWKNLIQKAQAQAQDTIKKNQTTSKK